MINKNMVDERFELISVIFRLAGREEYSDTGNDYSKEVAEKFAKFAEHPAVHYVKNDLSVDKLGGYLGYDAPFRFSVHIEKKDGKFVFIEDFNLLFDNRWGDGRAEKFLLLLNKFYADTDYNKFYKAHILHFEQFTQKFIDDVYSKIDFEWFAKYVDISNLRCILTESSGECEYGATVNDKIIYSLLFGSINSSLVHEFCHSFGAPLSVKLYSENSEFKKWCDDSVDIEKNPEYNHGSVIADEYVTRAYEILYWCQGYGNEKFTQTYRGITYKRNEFAPICIIKDFKNGFPYIEEIYKMLLEIENKRTK